MIKNNIYKTFIKYKLIMRVYKAFYLQFFVYPGSDVISIDYFMKM